MARFVTGIFVFACVFMVINGSILQPIKKEASCRAMYKRIGCYNDYHSSTRPLPLMLFTDRDMNDPKYSGIPIDWKNWETYSRGLACRCAKAAAKMGFKSFGIEYYGECWSNSELSLSFNSDGPSDQCIDKKYAPCHPEVRGVCVGKRNVIYVYSVCPLDVSC